MKKNLLQIISSVFVLLAAVAVCRGATVTLTVSDPGGTSSLNSAGKWSDGNPPNPLNDYYTGANFVRTPTDPAGSPAGLVYTFGGHSLTLQQVSGQGAPMRSILYKSGASDSIIINNLTNATGGVLNNGGSGNVTPIFSGNLWTIAGNSTLLSDQGSTIIGYPLVGSGVTLTIWSGQGRIVTFTNKLSGYSGKFEITNNLTVELNADAGFLGNPASFTPDQIAIGNFNNTTLLIHTPIQITNSNGGITLTAPGGQTVTFNIPNVSGTIFSEPITDVTNETGFPNIHAISRLAKSGAGIMILSNTSLTHLNDWQGGTTVASGTLQLGAANNLPPTNVVVNGTLDINGLNTIITNLTGGGVVDTTASSGTPTFTLGGSGTFNGVIQNSAGTLSLTMLGPGTNTLAGGYTYSGQTLVAGGTLNLVSSAALPSSAGNLIVSNGAVLNLDASSGIALPANNSTVATNATLNLTLNSAATALTNSGSLTFQDNATNNFNYGANLTGIPTGIAINAAGAISAPGSNIVINISGIGFKPGTITLIKYTGAPLANLNNFTLTVPAGVVATLVNNMVNPSIDVNISFAPLRLTWNGVSSKNWDTTTINWTNGDYGIMTNYSSYTNGSRIGGDLVLFDDTLTNDMVNPQPTNINVTGAVPIYPSRVTVASTLPYSMAGGGTPLLTGPMSLVKSNSGALSLVLSNSFSGGVIINDSSTIIITNDSALGTNNGVVTLNTGTLQVNGTTTNNSRQFQVPAASFIDVSNTYTAQFGTMSGAGSLIKLDLGTLAFAGNDNLAGALTVRQGALNAPSGTANLPAVVTVGDTASLNAALNIGGGLFGAMNNAAATTSGLIAGAGNGSDGDIRVTGGTLMVLRQLGLGAGAGGYGALSLSGGTVSNGSWMVVGFNNDLAVLNMTGGTFSISNNLITIAAGGSGSTGVANLSGGTFTSIGGAYAGEFGNGTLNVSGGATANLLGGGLQIGVQPAAAGTVNLNGGTVATPLVTQGSGAAALNFNGGTLRATASTAALISGLTKATIYNNGATLDDGGNTVTLSKPLMPATGFGVATIPLTANGSGYIDTPIVTISGGSGSGATATATVSGGQVTAVNVTCPGSGYSNSDSLSVALSGGGASVTAPTVGVITFVQNGTGGLTKQGSGTLSLTGINTFTGPITNKAGTLFLNSASTYSGPVVVNAGSLQMTPTPVISGTTTVTNATFTVFQVGSADATISNLTLNGTASGTGARVAFSITPANNAANPLLSCGTLTVNATNTITLAGALNIGTEALIHYFAMGGVNQNITNNLTLPQGAKGYLSNSVANSTLYAVITNTGPGIVWTGTNSDLTQTNVWNINSSTNWVLGSTPTTYQQTIVPGDAVTFNDIGSGTVNLNAFVSPSSTTISNNSTPYIFTAISSTAGISGPTGLLKVGSGTAALGQSLTNNNYTGNTTISNGTLVVTNGGTISPMSPAATLVIGPNGTLNLASALANAISPVAEFTGSGFVHYSGGINSILSFGGSSGGAWSGTIFDDAAGGLSLTKNGTGTWVVSGTNHLNNGDFFNGISQAQFDGGTTILTNGALMTVAYTECWIAQGIGSTSTVVVAGGTLSVSNNNLTIGRGDASANGTLIVNAGLVQKAGAGNLIVGGSGNANGTTQPGTLAGTGTLIVNGGRVLNNSALYLGQNATANGTLYLNGGLLQATVVTPNGATPNASIAYFNGGTLQASANSADFIQVLSMVLSNGLVLDDGGFTVSISAPLQPGDSFADGLIKKGAGVIYLDGANSYTGTTVCSNGLLAGVGTIAGPVLVVPTGTLGAGDAATVGTLNVNNSLTVQGSVMMRIDKTVSATNSDLITGISTANYGGTLVINNLSSVPLVAGDQFTLFSAATPSGNFSGITGSAGPGLVYNFTPSTGILSVVAGKTRPHITGFSLSGPTLNISGTNGTPSGPYVLLGSTNVTLPVLQWTPVLTNAFDGGGGFNLSTNVINPGVPLEFYIISQ